MSRYEPNMFNAPCDGLDLTRVPCKMLNRLRFDHSNYSPFVREQSWCTDKSDILTWRPADGHLALNDRSFFCLQRLWQRTPHMCSNRC